MTLHGHHVSSCIIMYHHVLSCIIMRLRLRNIFRSPFTKRCSFLLKINRLKYVLRIILKMFVIEVWGILFCDLCKIIRISCEIRKTLNGNSNALENWFNLQTNIDARICGFLRLFVEHSEILAEYGRANCGYELFIPMLLRVVNIIH